MEEPASEFPHDVSGEIVKYINNEVKNAETRIIITLTIENDSESLDIFINNKITYSDGSISSYSTRTGFLLSDTIPRVIFEEKPSKREIEVENNELVVIGVEDNGSVFPRQSYAQGDLAKTFKKILDLISFEENIEDAIAKIEEMEKTRIEFNVCRTFISQN